MTAGSGARLCGVLRKSGPYGRFLKTLLGSKTWASPEFYLRWTAKGIPSEFLATYTLQRNEESSTDCWARSHRSVTKWGRYSVFLLQPVEHRTGGLDTGLFADVWQTVTQNDMKSASTTAAERWADGTATTSEMRFSNQVKATWPTVTQALAEKSVRTAEGARRECETNAGPDLGAALQTWSTPRHSERVANFTQEAVLNRIEKTGYHSNLEEYLAQAMIASATKAVWSTMTKVTGEHPGRIKIKDGQQSCLSAEINGAMAMASAWPTPDASEAGKTSRSADRKDEALIGGLTRGPMPSGCLARTEKFVERLATLSAWLMGYTAAYLRHWETASSRKSRNASSQS